MKLILIEPNIEGRVGEPPTNLALLKAFINEKSDHKAHTIDLTFHKNEWKTIVRQRINYEKCDLIGIGCLSFNFNQALEIAKYIKTVSNVKIIFGGVHPILLPEEVISQSEVDIICTGEGEYTLKYLLDNNLHCKNIKGLWYKKHGQVIKNDKREIITDLDSLPFPDWDDFDLEKYFFCNVNHLPLMASRGCPYHCTYCSNHAIKKALGWKKVRYRSVESLIKEIKLRIDQYYDKGLRFFNFEDDIFISRKKFVLEFCKQFKDNGFHKKVMWNAKVRANIVTEEIIGAIKDAGCYEVGMGVESINEFIRNKIYKRNMSMEQINNAIQIIKKSKMMLHIPIIFGAPYETIEMMEENFKFLKDLNPETMLCPILMPLPGTEIRAMCVKEGLIEEGFNGAHVMYTKPVIRTKYISRNEVQKFIKKIRRFLIKKYFFDGLRLRKIKFIWDLVVFTLYYKPKFKLEIDNAFKFTVHKYKLEDIKANWLSNLKENK